MGISATIYKIDERKAGDIIHLLKQQINTTWHTITTPIGDGKLQLKINDIQDNAFGFSLKIAVDYPSSELYHPNQGTYKIPFHTENYVQLYSTKDLENYLVIFAKQYNAIQVYNALSVYLQKKLKDTSYPLRKCRIILDHNVLKDCKIFNIIKYVSAGEIEDDEIKKCAFTFQPDKDARKNQQYKEFIEDKSGQGNSVRAKDSVYNITLQLSKKGTVYIPSNAIDTKKEEYLSRVMINLLDFKALIS